MTTNQTYALRNLVLPYQPMVTEADEVLDDLLCRWHQHFRDNVGRGFNRRSLVCGDYRVSRQHDDINGALDANVEHTQMLAVDFAVSGMKDPHKAAIYANARALTVGSAVFSSPRLPADMGERTAVIREARGMLTRRLQSAGVM